ncbi:protein-disulfide reductase DsbD [Janthinobacterium sp.]|uniref:protein-disulfide reductase DsbD n=1 Tax=Janthinobacterium sp. TaxID=1871054 RepID=UPI00293D6BFF|nr:protein-disulfide reductase DsbD [Janthinobacterium sp.]
MLSLFPGAPRATALWRALLRCCALALFLLAALAGPPAQAEEDFLSPEAAFRFSARMQDGGTVAVTYEIADGYYMYRERFQFSATGATLGASQIPPGKVKFDETFQKNVETYRHTVTILIPVQAAGPFTLLASSQGCSEKGLCYAPQEARARLVGNAAAAPSVVAPPAAPAAPATSAAPTPGAPSVIAVPTPLIEVSTVGAPPASTVASPAAAPGGSGEMGRIESALMGGKLLVYLPLFLLLGLGLSFTPCVLPMVPILSFIIVGEGAKASRARAFLLSLTYVMGMALVYTALGVAAGLLGEGLAARLQNPWVLGTFALAMGGLSLSMFGFYELQVPAALQQKLTRISTAQTSGKLAGVFVMGAVSALIVGPCVAGPLAGILVYISRTGDAVVGASALFALAIGMGIPLLLLGMSAGALLPRAGAWMEAVKRFFGVLLLVTAWWLLSPVLPGALAMLGWSALGLGYGAYLLTRAGWAGKALGLAFALLGCLQLVGVASGGRDPLAPLAHVRGGQPGHLPFVRVKTSAQLDAALAQTGGKPALLDFYADWCVSCKEMEKLTFVDPRVRARLAGAVLLQVDVTANDADDKAMLKRFNLFGPPGIIMFDGRGAELAGARVIGFQDAGQFLASLDRLK